MHHPPDVPWEAPGATETARTPWTGSQGSPHLAPPVLADPWPPSSVGAVVQARAGTLAGFT